MSIKTPTIAKPKINKTAKEILTRLLATENLRITYKNTVTASFNLQSREVILPNYVLECEEDVHTTFAAHEVGHALYSDLTKMNLFYDKHKITLQLKDILNIVEDARIEKLMHRKYPGLRRTFILGYRKLQQIGFFGDKKIKDLGFLDRLNMFFKVQLYSGTRVPFTAEEEVFRQKATETETMEDCFALTLEIAQYIKDNTPEEKEEPKTKVQEEALVEIFLDDDKEDSEEGKSMESPEESELDEESDGEAEEDSDGGESEEDSDDEDEDEDDSVDAEENEDLKSSGSSKKKQEKPTEPEKEDDKTESSEKVEEAQENQPEPEPKPSSTDSLVDIVDSSQISVGSETSETMEKFLEKFIQESSVTATTIPTVHNIILPNVSNRTGLVIGHETIQKYFNETYTKLNIPAGMLEAAFKAENRLFNKTNKTYIELLVKEFEMRKAADEHQRTRISKTGILDVNKLHSYKFRDDIFKASSIVMDGKNHGLFMLLDCSGSMSGSMSDTINQLLILIRFCQRVQIPFRVYGFVSGWDIERKYFGASKEEFHQELSSKVLVPGEIQYSDDVKLKEYFNSSVMTPHQIESMFNNMLWSRKYYKFNLSNPEDVSKEMNDLHYHAGRGEYRGPRWSYSERIYMLPIQESLNCTPLHEGLHYSRKLIVEFRKAHNLSVVNMVCLTDGDATSENYYFNQEKNEIQSARYASGHIHVTDSETKMSFTTDLGKNLLGIHLEILKKTTGVKICNFRLVPKITPTSVCDIGIKYFGTDGPASHLKGKARQHMKSNDILNEISKKMEKDGFLKIEMVDGFDETYLIEAQNTRNDWNLDRELREIEYDAKKEDHSAKKVQRELHKAYTKNLMNKNRGRALVSSFAQLIAN